MLKHLIRFILNRLLKFVINGFQMLRYPKFSEAFSKEDIRRGIQLAILKGMQKNAQPHHQMTPDSIGMLIGHIAEKLVGDKKSVRF